MVYCGGQPYEMRDENSYQLKPTSYANKKLLISHCNVSVDLSKLFLADAMEKKHSTFQIASLIGGHYDIAWCVECGNFCGIGEATW